MLSSTRNVIGKATWTKASSKKRIVFVALILGLIVLAVLAGNFLINRGPADWLSKTTTVKRGSVDVRIVATGTIRPINEVKVSPKSTGLIKQLYVQQGDTVKQGQILAQMDDSNLQGQIEAARGTYLMVQDAYAKAMHGNRPQEVAIAQFQENRALDIVHQAEQNVTRLKSQLESMSQQSFRDDTLAVRQTYLETQGAISDQDRLNAQTQSKVTRANLDSAKRELAQSQATLAQNKSELSAAHKQYELSKLGNREEDILSAKHMVAQAKGNLDTLLAQQNDMAIRAPFTGVVTQKYADTGAIVTPTTSAATTSATSSSIVALAGKLEMVAQVAETDIGKIKIGQPVEIISNAFPQDVFFGHVTQIAPEAVVTQNVTTFEVHTTIDDAAPKNVSESSWSGGHHRRRHHGDSASTERSNSDSSGGSATAAASTSDDSQLSEHHHRHHQSDDSSPRSGGDDLPSKNDQEDHVANAGSSGDQKTESRQLLSGMNVNAKFVAGRMDDVLMVPTVCIVSRHGRTGVLIPQTDGEPEFKQVGIGPTSGTDTVIVHGVKEGDRVFLGLTKEQLDKHGYGSDSGPGGDHGGRGGGSGRGAGSSAPIPRSFGH